MFKVKHIVQYKNHLKMRISPWKDVKIFVIEERKGAENLGSWGLNLRPFIYKSTALLVSWGLNLRPSTYKSTALLSVSYQRVRVEEHALYA